MSKATIAFAVDESLNNDLTAADAQGRADAKMSRELMRDFTRQVSHAAMSYPLTDD